ncbi:MAG TPA: hypothetical protein VF621_06900 [Pyrinomonadaceae bacterium]
MPPQARREAAPRAASAAAGYLIWSAKEKTAVNNSDEINRGAGAGPAAGCETNSDGPPLRAPRPAKQRVMADKTERKFEGPVAWLLGSQLIRSIKGILLYSAYGQKLDPRDWMTAKLASFDTEDGGELADGVDGAALAARLEENGGFWFDYISDTGDGMFATYSIAYLCQSSLAVPTLEPGGLKAGAPALPAHVAGAQGGAVLPRGEFLLVGGDTAYHASDYQTLIDRIYNTFNAAHEDLLADGGLTKEEEPRPLYGIPGNHDYYDQLDGFRRQFRHPPLWERRPAAYRGGAVAAPPDSDDDCAQLSLKGFYRTQEASYLALKLPYGWWLWGLDTETGQIDERQKNFFHQFCKMVRSREGIPRPDRVIPPDRLIVATCAPTTAFGQLADPKFFKGADAFGQLGIEQPFLPARDRPADAKDDLYKWGEPAEKYPAGVVPDLTQTGDARLRPGQCRLDLSGDVHLYARYWGPPPPPCSITPRGGTGAKAQRPESHSYASVVSGIGGAFHHPSQTYFDEIREQSLYPSEKTSTDEVSGLIFKFWNIWNGGYVFLAGAVIAFLVYFAFTVPQSSRQALNNLPHFGLGLATSERVSPTTEKVEEVPGQPRSVAESGRAPVRGPFGTEWTPPTTPCRTGDPNYFYGPCRVSAPADFWVGLGMALVASLPLLLAAFYKKLYQGEPEPAAGRGATRTEQAPAEFGSDAKPSQEVETDRGNEIKPARRDPEIKGEPGKTLWGLYLLACVLFFVGMVMVKPYRAHITPFGSSLLVLLTFVWAGACVALNIRYTEFLFKRAHGYGQTDWELPWYLLGVTSLVAAGLGLWSFGQNNLPALLVSDMLFIGAMLLVFFGVVIALPFSAAVGLLAKRGAAGSIGKLLIGLWHYLLQIATPFILIRKASILTLVIAALVIAVGTPVGERLLARFKGGALAIAWVILGALTIILPVWLVPPARAEGGGLWHTLVQPWFVPDDWTGWLGLVPSVAAAVVGAVMCCYWFGWYLGVCFAFNGHNNEVGGAARIERFKQFVRFRLTREGLTGYVIAVNDPSDTGSELTPHVVDVFHLRPKPGA